MKLMKISIQNFIQTFVHLILIRRLVLIIPFLPIIIALIMTIKYFHLFIIIVSFDDFTIVLERTTKHFHFFVIDKIRIIMNSVEENISRRREKKLIEIRLLINTWIFWVNDQVDFQSTLITEYIARTNQKQAGKPIMPKQKGSLSFLYFICFSNLNESVNKKRINVNIEVLPK